MKEKMKWCVTLLAIGGVIAGNIYYQIHTFRETTQREKQITELKKSVIEQQNYTIKKEQELKSKDAQLQDALKKLQERDAKLKQLEQMKENLKGLSVKTDMSQDTFKYLNQVAKENDYTPELLFAIIEQESKWNPTLVSETNDHGLCQINACNFNDYAKRLSSKHPDFDIYDIHTNIDCMVLNLNDTRARYRKSYESEPSLETMLLAYNSGSFVRTASRGKYSSGVVGYMSQYKEWLSYVRYLEDLSNMW